MGLIPYSKQSISEEDIFAIKQVMRSDFLTQGPKTGEFESELASFFGVEHAVVCSSGTAALHLAYAALGIGPGSIGIVPAITFSATANALKYQDADIIFCDVEPDTGLIDVHSLERCLNEVSDKQKEQANLIAPVSFAGSVAPLEECRDLADKHGFSMIEDAAHSPGAWKTGSSGKTIKSAGGEWADASILSFHPVKHICCGEGGAILTNCERLSSSAKKLRSHGIQRPHDDNHPMPWLYEQDELGWNYRLTDLQAALGISQLNKLEESLAKRRKLASRYQQILQEKPFSEHFDLPRPDEGNAWHLFVIRFKEPGERDRAHKFLKGLEILTQVHYVPLHRHPYFKKQVGEVSLPGAEKFFEGCLSIPLYPQLSENEQDRVMEALARFIQQVK
jgi:dTDP-4-amino-4,6-dideoxygalactose transaminase